MIKSLKGRDESIILWKFGKIFDKPLNLFCFTSINILFLIWNVKCQNNNDKFNGNAFEQLVNKRWNVWKWKKTLHFLEKYYYVYNCCTYMLNST